MKIVITGHTSGIGKYLFEYFSKNKWEVKGMSRSNGYDISSDQDKIINESLDASLFINNANFEDYQCKILEELNNKVKNIISIGSIAGYYTKIFPKKHLYTMNKKKLIDLNRKLSYTSSSNLLLINVSNTENTSPDPGCSYDDIAKTCVYWLSMPNINQIDFRVKLSDINKKLIEDNLSIKLQDHRNIFL